MPIQVMIGLIGCATGIISLLVSLIVNFGKPKIIISTEVTQLGIGIYGDHITVAIRIQISNISNKSTVLLSICVEDVFSGRALVMPLFYYTTVQLTPACDDIFKEMHQESNKILTPYAIKAGETLNISTYCTVEGKERVFEKYDHLSLNIKFAHGRYLCFMPKWDFGKLFGWNIHI